MLSFGGCSNFPPTGMLTPRGLPEDRASIHPWIADLLDHDVAGVAAAIHHCMSTDASPEMRPLIACVADFVPLQIDFSKGTGYIVCVKKVRAERTLVRSDILYIAQPLREKVIDERRSYFDEPLQPLMKEFLSKFSGCGEQMEGFAGQFVFDGDTIAADIAYYKVEKLGVWEASQLLYSASNGDSVFINEHGATAWHVFDTNDIVPLFDSFPDFVRHYAESRKTTDEFNSWASRKFLGLNPWKE